jgi:hypothetical protein
MRGFFNWLMQMTFYAMVMVGVCILNIALYRDPFRAPTWMLVVEGLSLWLFISLCEIGVEKKREEREERLELAKHLLTLQYQRGKLEPPDDPTRIPKDFLKAYEKPQSNGVNQQAQT